ncbi:hypothetical protein HHL22_20760 [Hymenobacter sp. RP-2-7]|uniref:Uncharacterized protein n=1 Tax=Hymenobacter polaris TaxID=2682546 RepID=A0A7Y0AIC7_9BACT|nr:hypothetical protein [Hymenobacter polaris]NML67640.1 hypothetical protein [Hymenobacter polaris]
MQVDTTPPPAPEPVNPQELEQLLRAVRRAWRPGACLRTILASIVATGCLLDIDYSQERDYAEPLLLAGNPVRVLEQA